MLAVFVSTLRALGTGAKPKTRHYVAFPAPSHSTWSPLFTPLVVVSHSCNSNLSLLDFSLYQSPLHLILVPFRLARIYMTHTGDWLSFPATTWTSAFFSLSLYALHERHSVLCPAVKPTSHNGSTTTWLTLARKWSTGLYNPDEALTTTHDVGFLSWAPQWE